MSAIGLCGQCQTVRIEGLIEEGEPSHCYGTGDETTPGLIGGFVCSCPCRHWVKPDQPRFAAEKKRKVSYLSTAQLATLSHACIPLKEALGGIYLVGSSTERPDFRDVDVRSIVEDEKFDAIFGGREFFWSVFCWAVSEWLSKLTGLPIDYQAQRQTEANEKYGSGYRNALGVRGRVFAGGGDATRGRVSPDA